MVLRKNIFPRTKGEYLSTGSNVIFTPLNYYVFNFVVLPQYWTMWSEEYTKHFIISSFLTFMMCSNMLALVLCDTTVKGRFPALNKTRKDEWKYCDKCQTSMPPRSWHCTICNTCILKRDHHCFFTSCCVGFHNHRHFMMYLFYTALTTMYASYFNFRYAYDTTDVEYTWMTLVKLLFPMLSVFFIKWSLHHLYLLVIFETFAFGLMCCFMLVWCGYFISRNMVIFDKEHSKRYRKSVMENVQVVFGRKWYLVWQGPWVSSELPCDGTHWDKYM
ncbi:unnamed protein product [Phyllotreta striolata]|uniref:Palmitoyltransferase n=1 Tax=Phyllotreta striolata TaxID=444603 RepID=A0A9N9TE05_PHYSR|nr:unnamed protein product [Phyllotreta striolata]